MITGHCALRALPPTSCPGSELDLALAAPVPARTQAQRQLIVEAHLHLLEPTALQVAQSYGGHVDPEDFQQDGFFGLVDAAAKFDPGRGFKFVTYANRRIQGAMRDGQRDRDSAPRLVRDRQRKYAGIASDFRSLHDREPGDSEQDLAELARIADVDALEIRRIIADGRADVPVARLDLDRSRRRSDQAFDRHDTLHDKLPDLTQRDPADVVGARLDAQQLLSGLNRTERLAWTLYHGGHATMRQTGHALGLSESRVSQILSSLQPRLQARAAVSDGRGVR